MRKRSLSMLLCYCCFAAACSAAPPAPMDAGTDLTEPTAPVGFERFCEGQDFVASQQPFTAGKLSGTYKGSYRQGPQGGEIPEGMLEMMRIIPSEPMIVDTLRAAFAKGTGRVRLRLEYTLGRSYPASYMRDDPGGAAPTDFPDYDEKKIDVIPPVEIDVSDASPETWVEIDVSQYQAALLPTEHYMLIYEHLQAEPYLAIESVPTGDESLALLMVPGTADAFGVSISATEAGNYRLEIAGRSFCTKSAADKDFTDTKPAAFPQSAGAFELADLNGDGHEDIVAGTGHASPDSEQQWLVYFGDGHGNFTQASFDALALADRARTIVFADFDNDGDQDALAFYYVYPDQDGDGKTVQSGDCNDVDAAIHPGATEVANKKDDNCDGIADEGTAGAGDTSDMDGDGYTVAAGDCDDTQPTVHPGAPELMDGRDNDCNHLADEVFHHRLLLNSGDGHFVAVASPTIELAEPIGSTGVGDTNGDGILDVYWGNWLIHYPDAPAWPSHFVEGNGDGTFVDRMAMRGIIIPTPKPDYGVTFNDFNNDGWQDIYVGNYQLNDNFMWSNDGTGAFTNVAAMLGIDHDEIPGVPQLPGGHSYGSDFADIDNDGDMDFFLCNLSHPRTQPWADTSKLYFNQGAPGYAFVDKRVAYGIAYDEGDINAVFGDYDNDMDEDLVIAGAYPMHYTRVYRNDGDHFTDVTYQTGAWVRNGPAGWADVDEDGALDLVAHDGTKPNVHVYLNKIGKKNNWVELVLQGKVGAGGHSNRDGVGARVKLAAGGVTQMRDVRGTTGGGITSNLASRLVHFGLAQNGTIDSVTVRWVGGATETFTGVQTNGLYRLIEGAGAATKIR